MRALIFGCLFIFLFMACRKKVTYSGVVYSKHHIGVPNQKILFGLGFGGKDLDDTFEEACTDGQGAFFAI